MEIFLIIPFGFLSLTTFFMLNLLGLSWFYTRFVFGNTQQAVQKE